MSTVVKKVTEHRFEPTLSVKFYISELMIFLSQTRIGVMIQFLSDMEFDS